MSRRWPSNRPVPASLAAVAGLAAVAVLAGCGSKPVPGSATAASATAAATASATAGSGPGGTATGSPSASASGPGAAAAACAAAGLRVRLDTAAEGVAAGTAYIPLEFTNTSSQACRLTGYPAVALTTGVTGQQIGTEAAVDRAVRAGSVLLPPGGTAHAWLQVLSTANYPAGQCHPVTAAGLRVVAPGTQSASYVPDQVPACKAAVQGSAILTVHPVQQGPARRGTA
jgi:hypothetical protein